MKKITKNTVKSIIKKNGSIKVTLYPCKANINSPWIQGCDIEPTSLEELEKHINAFSYYNCTNELGLYPHFYIKEGEI